MKRRVISRGFTLIELLVVIAIIALLVSILVPTVAQAKAMAQKVQCASHLRSMTQGIVMYCNDYSEYVPPLWVVQKSASTNQEVGYWWADYIVGYFDSDAKLADVGGQNSVGIQPANGSYVGNYGARYSRRMYCSGQKRAGRFHFTWNVGDTNRTTAYYLAWGGNWNGPTLVMPGWANIGTGWYYGPDDRTWREPRKLSHISKPGEYAAIVETQPQFFGNPCASLPRLTYERTYFAAAAPHAKMLNLGLLGGQVSSISALDMLNYDEISGVAPFRFQPK